MTATIPAAERPIAERDWQETVVSAAKRLNWLCYFTWRSDHSPAGFPDLILIKDDRCLVMELKVGTNNLRPAQVQWLTAFEQVREITVRGPVYPDDWDDVLRLLAA